MGLHPTTMARLRETPIAVGSVQEASGRLGDGGASSNLGGDGEKMEGGQWGGYYRGKSPGEDVATLCIFSPTESWIFS
jgi:hypothetical protein